MHHQMRTWLIGMAGRAPQRVMQIGGKLVNITSKTPTVRGRKIVISTNKVFMGSDSAKVVTGKAEKKRERQALVEEGRYRQQTSLAYLQQYVEIVPHDREESPKFEPVQESSPPEMPPSAQELLTPSDGDPNPPAVRGSSDENCHNLQDFAEIDQTDRDESPKFDLVQESSPRQMSPSDKGLLTPSDGDPNPPADRGSLDENCHKHLWSYS